MPSGTLGTPIFFSFFLPCMHAWPCVFTPMCVSVRRASEVCISMIRRTATNDCFLREDTWLSWRDVGRLHTKTRALAHGSTLKRETRDVKETHTAQSCMWQLWGFTCCAWYFKSPCVQMHQILMGIWSVVEPHYHNFFWGKNTDERVSFIATTTELQAKADDKNSLKVSCAVNLILRFYTEWNKWKIYFFLLFFF